MDRLTTEAVVLRARDHGEADRLLHLLTPRDGRIRAVARSARRPQSRMSGSLLPATRATFTLVPGRELYTLTGVRAPQRFDWLHASLLPMAAATYLMEIADQSLGERDPAPEVYGLLLGVLTMLDAQQSVPVVLRAGEVRMLALMGFAPDLYHCARCRVEVEAPVGFLPSEGVLCTRCRGHGLPLGETTLQILRTLAHAPLGELGRVRLPPGVGPQLDCIVSAALDARLGRAPRSRAFLVQLLAGATAPDGAV